MDYKDTYKRQLKRDLENKFSMLKLLLGFLIIMAITLVYLILIEQIFLAVLLAVFILFLPYEIISYILKIIEIKSEIKSFNKEETKNVRV